jgi:hypothetical protein
MFNEPKILSIQELNDEQLLKEFEYCKSKKDSIISKIYYPSFIKELKKRGIEYNES